MAKLADEDGRGCGHSHEHRRVDSSLVSSVCIISCNACGKSLINWTQCIEHYPLSHVCIDLSTDPATMVVRESGVIISDV